MHSVEMSHLTGKDIHRVPWVEQLLLTHSIILP